MTVTIPHGSRSGLICAPASKSYAHRAVIAAALSFESSVIICDGISKDIEATISCMNSAGADIKVNGSRIEVKPIKKSVGKCSPDCGESGSTLRFLLPVFGALGINAEFLPKGRLYDRPLSPLDEVLSSHGVTVKKHDGKVSCQGQLIGGEYKISGDVSSQYISGLLMALPLLEGDSTLEILGNIQSQSYIKMTEDVLKSVGIMFEKSGNVYKIFGRQKPGMNGEFIVEGDYSNAAFFMCMGAVSEKGVTVSGLNLSSSQGDKAVIEILKRMGADIAFGSGSVTVKKNCLLGTTIDASQIPDLIPTLCALACVCKGQTVVINGERLKIKESDRILSTCRMLSTLGADITPTDDGMIINGKAKLKGGTVDSFNDHRIAMSAAVASCSCDGDVTVNGAECVEKSYPEFWNDFSSLEIETEEA